MHDLIVWLIWSGIVFLNVMTVSVVVLTTKEVRER